MTIHRHMLVATAAQLARRRGFLLTLSRQPLRGAGEKPRLQFHLKPLPEKKP